MGLRGGGKDSIAAALAIFISTTGDFSRLRPGESGYGDGSPAPSMTKRRRDHPRWRGEATTALATIGSDVPAGESG
jgi:hypothetical protein